jgi:hypothetical protein
MVAADKVPASPPEAKPAAKRRKTADGPAAARSAEETAQPGQLAE